MNEPRSLTGVHNARFLLLIVALLAVAPWIGRELVLGRTIGIMRTADVLDMLVVAPILG